MDASRPAADASPLTALHSLRRSYGYASGMRLVIGAPRPLDFPAHLGSGS